MQVSHETIYRSLFVQSRGVLKRALVQHLRRQRPRRRARAAGRVGHYPGHIVDAVSIRQRPAEAADRAVPGHWEGDLLMGAGRSSQVATLVERQSRYVVLVRVPKADTQTVVRALTRRVRHLPQGLVKSLTWDRGTELAGHRDFTIATNVQVYFCDPQSPWQRGSNENTNGLLRQYLPKGTDLSTYSQAQLDAIALRLNTRPRLTLGFQTPAAKLAQSLRRPVETAQRLRGRPAICPTQPACEAGPAGVTPKPAHMRLADQGPHMRRLSRLCRPPTAARVGHLYLHTGVASLPSEPLWLSPRVVTSDRGGCDGDGHENHLRDDERRPDGGNLHHRELDAQIVRVKAGFGATLAMGIGGRDAQAASTFEVRSPIDTRILISRCQQGGRQETKDAIAAARAAYPAWSARPWQERVALLRKVADGIRANRWDLSALMGFEAGKNRLECVGDVEEAADLIAYYSRPDRTARRLRDGARLARPGREELERDAPGTACGA